MFQEKVICKIKERRQESDSATEDDHVPDQPQAEIPAAVHVEVSRRMLRNHAPFIDGQVAEAKLFLDRNRKLATVLSQCLVGHESTS